MESTPTSSLASRLSSLLNYCKNNGLGPTLRFIPIRLRASLATNEFGWNLFFKNNPFILTGELDDYANSVEDVWAEFKKVDGLTCEHFVFQNRTMMSMLSSQIMNAFRLTMKAITVAGKTIVAKSSCNIFCHYNFYK